MTDKDLAPYIERATDAYRAEQLRSQEIDAIGRVIATLTPFLESGYAVNSMYTVGLSDYPQTEQGQIHAHGTFYRPDWRRSWLWVRNDGGLFICRTVERRFRAPLFELHPWLGERGEYIAPQYVLELLLTWRHEILTTAAALKADLDKRAQQIQDALAGCE